LPFSLRDGEFITSHWLARPGRQSVSTSAAERRLRIPGVVRFQRIFIERRLDGPREDFEFDFDLEFEFILFLAGLDRKFMLVARSDAVLFFGGLYASVLVFSAFRLTGPVRVD
jgi:hypothetical protein